MIRTIQTTTSQNGSFVTVIADDGDGNLQTYVHVQDDATMARVTEFVNGAIDEAALICAMSADIDVVDSVRRDIQTRISRVSEHLATDGLHVYFDNDSFDAVKLDTALENHLIRAIKAGDEADIRSWAAFAERLYGNVDERIRAQIVSWLEQQEWLTLDAQGRLVGYRGCAADARGTATPYSVNTGVAIVDGQKVSGHIPNRVGSIVEMRRSDVQNDPTVGCSAGLHVGTYDYAVGWAPRDGWLLRVAVAPEDIVSVPFECASSKIRCCRFEVLEATPAAEHQRERYESELTWEDDDCEDEYEGFDENDLD